jgi:hypothetical protein
MAAHAFHQVLVGDPDAEHEAPGRKLPERFEDRLHRHGVTRVDVGDARGEHQGFGLRRQEADQAEGVAAHRFRGPEG